MWITEASPGNLSEIKEVSGVQESPEMKGLKKVDGGGRCGDSRMEIDFMTNSVGDKAGRERAGSESTGSLRGVKIHTGMEDLDYDLTKSQISESCNN